MSQPEESKDQLRHKLSQMDLQHRGWCFPFLHRWGPWELLYWRTGMTWLQGRECMRCNKTQVRERRS